MPAAEAGRWQPSQVVSYYVVKISAAGSRNMVEQIRDILKTTRLDEILDVYLTRAEALAATKQ